jgi:ABC-2 type transport system permease protein
LDVNRVSLLTKTTSLRMSPSDPISYWNIPVILMNDILYWAMLKNNARKVLGYSMGVIVYEWLITWVYPILTQSPVIEEISKSFPDPVKRAFGVSTGDEVDLSFEAYISAQLLSRLWTLFISVYGINASNNLVPHMVEQGFMAYPLSSPISRFEVFNTQVGVLLTELLLVTGATIGGVYSAAAFFKLRISRWQFFRMGITGFCLGSMISAYSLLLGVISGGEDASVRLSSVITAIFYGLDVVSALDDRFATIRRFTPFGMFRPLEVLQGNVLPTKQCLDLSVLSGISLLLARVIFGRKNLDL